MTLAMFIVPAFAAAVLSYLLTPVAGRIAVLVGAVDMPGPRKVHQRPIPRLGGLAVVAAIVIVVVAAFGQLAAGAWASVKPLWIAVGLGVLPIVAISILDDIKTLRPTPKFIAHAAGAIIAVSLGVSLGSDVHLFGYTITLGYLAFPLSVLWIIGVTNAFNIVDGLDGLSAGLALISAASLAGVFITTGQYGPASAVLVLAGALAGFLPHNLYPARMFLGDTGATAAGFCLAAFALKGGATLSAGFAALLPVLALGMPIAETLISMSRRVMKRFEHSDAGGMFEADRNHMHHRLLALGIGHPSAVLILYGAGVCLASAALISTLMTARDAALLLIALLLAGFLGVRKLGYDEFAIVRNGVALRVYDAPVLNRSMFVVFVDLLIVAAGVYVAIALKTDDWNLASHGSRMAGMIGVLAPITVATFSRMGVYRGTWRLAGVEEFVTVSSAVLVAALLGWTARMLLAPAEASLSLFSIYALVGAFLVISSRASFQILTAFRQRGQQSGTPALIYGAGKQGVKALRELGGSLVTTFAPVGFIDDDPAKSGRLVHGLPVVGSFRMLETAIRRFAARAIIVSSEAIPTGRLEELGEICERLGVSLLRMQVSFDLCGAGDASVATRGIGNQLAFGSMAAEPAPPTVRFERACVPGTRVPIVAGIRCPACESFQVRRSRVRTTAERVRKYLTPRRPYRCEQCNWRGWSQVLEAAVYQSFPSPSQLPKLDQIDHVLQRADSNPKRLAS